ncbi:hypothetical protein [Acidipila sp. EB88]|uniref:hypothetical protein n=1 Tax=Acidipila sp. EB88 TaxID=2305226 RepID=UPI000F600369|nr:hypothetical protein [Acidipila sp. EB88]RRA48155.1 hypothetical protein D1Y84_07510 [Acidipila sp. EB88]
MTLRFIVLFALSFVVLVSAEWFSFFREVDFSHWPTSNWAILAFAILAEAAALFIITRTLDRALPSASARALANDYRQPRRGRDR